MAKKAKKFGSFKLKMKDCTMFEEDLPVVDVDGGDNCDTGDDDASEVSEPKTRKKSARGKFWAKGESHGDRNQVVLFPLGTLAHNDYRMTDPNGNVYRATACMVEHLNAVNDKGNSLVERITSAKELKAFIDKLPATVKKTMSDFFVRYQTFENQLRYQCPGVEYRWQVMLCGGHSSLCVTSTPSRSDTSKSTLAGVATKTLESVLGDGVKTKTTKGKKK